MSKPDLMVGGAKVDITPPLHIPFLGALLKNEKDTEALEKYQERGGRYPTEWKELGPRYNN